MRYIYTLSKSVNYADTCRDSDNICTEILEQFSSKKKAKQYIFDLIKKEYKRNMDLVKLPESIEFDNDGNWYYPILGSWTPTFCLSRRELK